MIVRLNKRKCNGCGVCVSKCPEVFELGSDRKAGVICNLDKHFDSALSAEVKCPNKAIEVIFFK